MYLYFLLIEQFTRSKVLANVRGSSRTFETIHGPIRIDLFGSVIFIWRRLMTQGIDGDSFCIKTPYTKVRKLSPEGFYRQYNSTKVQQQIGGTSSALLQDIAVQIQDICNRFQLDVEYQQIPGVKNIQAHALSRHQHSKNLLYESTIPTRIFQRINRKWGPLKIDAFANRINHKLPNSGVYNSTRRRRLRIVKDT